MCAPQDEALGRPPPGIKCHCSLPLTEPSSEMPHLVCLSAVLPRRKNGHPPLVRGSHSSTPPGAPRGDLWISLCLTPGCQGQDPKQEVGGSWVGMKPAGGQSRRCCLPCWSLELESWQKAPEMQVEMGRGRGLCLSVLMAPQPVLSPSPPLCQAGPASCCHPHAPLPAQAPAGVGSTSHTGLVSPASCLVGLGVCYHEFNQAGAQGHRDEARSVPLHLHRGDLSEPPVDRRALAVAQVAAY